MSYMETSWLPEAKILGYSSEREMLCTLYLEENFSIKEISRVLGFSAWSVRRRLIENGVQLRERGGPMRLGNRRLVKVDDKELFELSITQLMEKYNTGRATICAERRLRKCNSPRLSPLDGLDNLPANPILS